MAEDRRHASIMFTDIVGYTRLMGSDEMAAFDMLKRNREIHQSLITEHKGTLVKEFGDGILASFALASDAVRSAIAIQEACKEAGIPLKIGIHQGELVFAGSDILGDGVNIASRLQEAGCKGSIFISGAVYQDIKNKTDLTTSFAGEKTLKNLDEPLKVYEVGYKGKEYAKESVVKETKNRRNLLPLYIFFIILVITIIILLIRNLKTTHVPENLERSIAVLPFKNLSSNPEDQYLADGMMESILTHLQKIKNLSVRSRTSVEQFRDADRNIADIGKALGVAHIVEGSFQKVGNEAQLTIQLIEAATDEHLWADEYNRDWSDVFRVQQEVAEKVASELYLSISPEEREIIETIPTTELSAYDFYLRARNSHQHYLMGGFFPLGLGPSAIVSDYVGALRNAIRLYRTALKIDPGFAEAYTGLGLAYWNLYAPANLQGKADTILFLADKALTFNERLDEAYFLKGIYYRQFGGNFSDAIVNLKMAIEINPNFAIAYMELGSVYVWETADYVEGLKSLHKAYELDRSYWLAYTLNALGHGYLFSGFDEIARNYFKELLILEGDTVDYYLNLAYAEWSMGNLEKALEWSRRALKIDSTAIRAIDFLAFRYSYAGEIDLAYDLLERYYELNNIDSLAFASGVINQFTSQSLHRVGYILLKKGMTEIAEDYFDEQIRRSQEAIEDNDPYAIRGHASYDLFAIYAFLGQEEKAFSYLEKFRNKKFYPNWLISYAKFDPLLDKVREDPRFRAFLAEAEEKFSLEHERVKAWLALNNQL